MKRVLLFVTAAAIAGAQELPSYKDLKYPPLAQVKIPEPATVTLSNGMRVFLLEDHELPLIQGLAMVRTGNLFDPADKRGLSTVMAEVLRSGGTKSKTGDQIDEQLENIAASVESSMDETSASISFSGLKESAAAVLAAFKDVLTQPEFRQDKIDLSLSQMRSGIARRNDDANGIPDRELLSIVYGRNTSYGWQIEYEHLARIHRDDLIDFYKRYYFPKNILLAVYGDFSTAEMQDKLEKLFADWKVEQPPVPPFPKVETRPSLAVVDGAPSSGGPTGGIYLAEKPDVTQTFFAIGELGGTLRDKDYAALQVAADILGQGFSSRLVSQIRTKLGYAYDISAQWAAQYDHPGTFRIGGSTKSASTTETIRAIGDELTKIRQTEVSERELSEAKDAVLNSFVFNFDSPAKTLSRVLRYEYYGYPKDFLFQYRKAVDSVTRADVQRAARDHFKAENLTIVAVGNPKEFGKPLTELGKVNKIDLTIPEPKAEVSKSDASSQARGRELLQRAQKAMGGADKLAAVKDSNQTAEIVMAGAGVKIKQHNRYLAPGSFRQDLDLPFGKVATYTDGKTGWMVTPQGSGPMNDSVLKQAQGEVFRNLVRLMIADRDPSNQVNAVADDTVEVSSKDGSSVRIQFDAISGLPLREIYTEGPVASEESFSDWRDTDGLKVPFKIAIQQDGKKMADIAVLDYKFNTGVKAEELSQKP
ncbi:MAG TPA: pitrilysin family protein [Bryobacteraceae bacterium]|nr:pitrilysin family protein [Bryobacteraceae bacterium]